MEKLKRTDTTFYIECLQNKILVCQAEWYKLCGLLAALILELYKCNITIYIFIIYDIIGISYSKKYTNSYQSIIVHDVKVSETVKLSLNTIANMII